MGKLIKDENYVLKDEFITLMAETGKVSKKSAEKSYNLFLKTLNEKIIKEKRSVRFLGIMTIFKMTYPSKPVNSFLTKGKTVMSKEKTMYRTYFTVNDKIANRRPVKETKRAL